MVVRGIKRKKGEADGGKRDLYFRSVVEEAGKVQD